MCDEFDLGVQNDTWWPRYMAVDSNNYTKHIYLTERDCNSIFCFSLKGRHLSLRRQYQFGSSLDSEDNILIEIDERGHNKTSHSDIAIVRPFVLAYSNGNVFITTVRKHVTTRRHFRF